jgi:polyamine oxidase
MMLSLFKSFVLSALVALQLAAATPLQPRNGTCQKTSVVVLGAGMSGIAAAQAMSNASMTDFIIVDVNSYIGGRVAHTNFGKDANGNPYTVELGANWVQGLVSPGGPENPIWTLAQKYNLTNTYSNYSSIQTFDWNGPANYTEYLDDYENAYSLLEQDAGTILSQNYQDHSMRVGLSLAGFKPKKNMQQQASEWWEFDWEYSYSPELSSETWAVVVSFPTYELRRSNILIINLPELQYNFLPIQRRQQLRLRLSRL